MQRVWMAIAVFGLFLVQCGKSTLSCQIPSAGTCIDYVGATYATQTTTLQSSCGTSSGTFSSSAACPTANRIGSCDYGPGNAAELVTRYYSPTYTTANQATLQSTCTASTTSGLTGTWTSN